MSTAFRRLCPSRSTARPQLLAQPAAARQRAGFPRRPDQYGKGKGSQVTRESDGNQASSPGALAPAPLGASRAERLYSEPWVRPRREQGLNVPSHGLPHTLRFLGADSILRLHGFLRRLESQENLINYIPYSKCHVSNEYNFYGCNHSEWEVRNKDILENLQLRKWNRYSLRASSATSLPATIGNVKNLPCPPLRLLQAEVLRVFRRLGLFLVLPQQSCSPAWTRAVCTGLSMAWASVPGWAIFCSADSSRPEAESSRRRWRSQVAQVLASSPILSRPRLFHLYAFTFLLGNRDGGCMPLGSTGHLSCSLGPMTRYDILSDSGGGLLKRCLAVERRAWVSSFSFKAIGTEVELGLAGSDAVSSSKKDDKWWRLLF